LDQYRRQALEGSGRPSQETRQLVPDGRQRRTRTKELLQHVPIVAERRCQSYL
jgi:hypothetical protein